MGISTANHGRNGMTLLGTKTCMRCHQRKLVKGGKQSSDGKKFVCAGCKKP